MKNIARNFAGAIILVMVLAIGANPGPIEPGLQGTHGRHPAPAAVTAVVTAGEEGVAVICIDAPTVGAVGELIRLDVSKSQADSFKWLLVPESVDFEVYDSGRRAVFSARKTGSYMFIVACAKDGMVDVATHVIVIKKPGAPDPNTEYPKVEEPAPGASLAKLLPYWCSQAKRSPEMTVALAESFESMAAAISAGIYTEVSEINKATAAANRDALGHALESWMPVLSKLQTELRRRATAGMLKTPEQHANAWREIAEGFLDYAALFTE